MKRQKDDMQVNVAGIRRNIKNLAHNYSDAQIKVREATSNDPWGPSATLMAEIADLTYNVVAFSEIMQMIWKRLNDHGKNWRHVYKALILLEYLIKTGTEKVAQQCKENIYAIQTLRDFQYMEDTEGMKDQGVHVREKAKLLGSLLRDEERLKNERTKALKAKERFAQHASGFGSDGSIDGPTHRESPSWRGDNEPRAAAAAAGAPDIEFFRPQTVGEEELQLQLAMAMSREEAEQEEAKRRSDDVRLQLALSQSEQDFNVPTDTPRRQPEPKQSHLMDLLDISLGATNISSPPPIGDPWGAGAHQKGQTSGDPWSGPSSPPGDIWGGASAKPSGISNVEGWLSRTQSPSVASGSSTEGWLQGTSTPTRVNGNGTAPPDPWTGITKQSVVAVGAAPSDTWNKPPGDPWNLTTPPPYMNSNQNSSSSNSTAAAPLDPWAPVLNNRPSPIGALTSPISDLDEFDIITNRSKTPHNSTEHTNGTNNNNSSLLDDLDPLSTKKVAPPKTPQSFLGENSALVNLDNLIKPAMPINSAAGQVAYNPFGDVPRTNLFQQPTQPNNNTNNNNMPWLKPEAVASNPFLS